MERNKLLEKYRRESQILHPVQSVLNETVNKKDLNNVRNHLIRLKGSDSTDAKPGTYYDPLDRNPSLKGSQEDLKWIPCKLSQLMGQQEELQGRFEQYCEERSNIGDRRPESWPGHLEEKRLKLAARVQVCREEIQHLEEILAELEENQSKNRESLLKHPKDWGTGQLSGGILVSIGPWDVAPNEEGILCIHDEDSPYNTMQVWRFKAQVVNPINAEYRFRQREEMEGAVAENRKRKAVRYPAPPTWDRKKDQLEYKNYSNVVLRKLKTQDV